MRYGQAGDDCVVEAYVAGCCAGLLLVLAMSASCERRAVAPTPVPMTDPLYEAQKRSLEEGNARWDKQMDGIDAQNKRYDVLLERWEAHADRVDRLLERWEAFLSELEARIPVHGDVATEP